MLSHHEGWAEGCTLWEWLSEGRAGSGPAVCSLHGCVWWDSTAMLGAILILWLGLQTNCVLVWHGSPPHFTGRWDDRSCVEEKHGYICQRSIGRVWGDRAPLCRGGGCCKHPTLWECQQWDQLWGSVGQRPGGQTVGSTWPCCFLGHC